MHMKRGIFFPMCQQGNRPRSKSKSLFEDEDLLFGGGATENPDVDLFGATSPLSPAQVIQKLLPHGKCRGLLALVNL